MKRIVLLFIILNFRLGLRAQSVIFIEKNGTTYSDSTSTPAINVLTGELVRAKDIVKDTINIKKSLNSLPNNPANLMINYPSGYLIEPKKNSDH